jgi:hypothetical protein
MGGEWLDTRRADRGRVDEAVRGLKSLYDSYVEPNPTWVEELLAKLK